VTELRTAARLEPNRPEVHNLLGLALATLNHNAEAISQFDLALKARPDYASARFNPATARPSPEKSSRPSRTCAKSWPPIPPTPTRRNA